MCLYEPCGKVCNVRLRVGQTGLRLGRVVCVDDGTAEFLREIGTILHKGLLDGSADGCVPAVVAECGEESLVDCAAFELACQVAAGHHVVHRVFVAFCPELVG